MFPTVFRQQSPDESGESGIEIHHRSNGIACIDEASMNLEFHLLIYSEQSKVTGLPEMLN